MAQYLRPSSEIYKFNDGYTLTGSYLDIDEVTANDADYIYFWNGAFHSTKTGIYEAGLSSVDSPSADTGHVIRFRALGVGGTANTSYWAKIILRQGATTIATYSSPELAQSTWNNYSYTLSEAEAATITNYSDLNVRIEMKVTNASNQGAVQIGWLEVEVPDGGPPAVDITVNADPLTATSAQQPDSTVETVTPINITVNADTATATAQFYDSTIESNVALEEYAIRLHTGTTGTNGGTRCEQVSFDTAVTLTGVGWEAGSTKTDSLQAVVYATDGTLLGSSASTSVDMTHLEWYSLELTTPVELSANTIYLIGFFTSTGSTIRYGALGATSHTHTDNGVTVTRSADYLMDTSTGGATAPTTAHNRELAVEFLAEREIVTQATSVTVDSPLTATAQLEAPVVDTTKRIDVEVALATATLEAPDLTLISDKTVEVDVSNHTATLWDSEIFTGRLVEVDVTTATTTFHDPTTDLVSNPTVDVDHLTATARLVDMTITTSKPYGTLVLNSNPTHYWKMDAESGSITDQIGTYHLTPAQTIMSTTGIGGSVPKKAINFGQNTNVATTTSQVFPNSIGWTFEGWVRWNDSTIQSSVPQIIFGTRQFYSYYSLGQTYSGYRHHAVYIKGNTLYSATLDNTGDVVAAERDATNKRTLGTFPINGSWVHVVVSCFKPSSGTYSTKAWINGTKTYDQAVLTYQGLNEFVINGSYRNGTPPYWPSSKLIIDEVATYDKELTTSEVSSHYLGGQGQVNIAVEADPATATAEGYGNTITVTLNAATATATAQGYAPTTEIDGVRTIFLEPMAATATLPEVEFIRMTGKTIEAQTANSTASTIWASARLYLAETAFKIIPGSDTSLTAVDAEELDPIEFGAVLSTQEKIFPIRIGNTSDTDTGFEITFQSQNDLVHLFALSFDKVNWYSGITIDTVPPNSMSRMVWVKFEPAESTIEGVATILLNVEQLYA